MVRRRAGKGGAALRETVVSNADTHAIGRAPIVNKLQSAGHESLRPLARGAATYQR